VFSILHAVPFHDSAKVEMLDAPTQYPTAAQEAGVGHEMSLKLL
jgi:hypothetical protein